jgi:hypothetical protein
MEEAAKQDTPELALTPQAKPRKVCGKKGASEPVPKEPAGKSRAAEPKKEDKKKDIKTPSKTGGRKRKFPKPEKEVDEDPKKTLIDKDETKDTPSPGKKVKIDALEHPTDVDAKPAPKQSSGKKYVKKQTTAAPAVVLTAEYCSQATHNVMQQYLALIDPIIEFQEICAKQLKSDLELEANTALAALRSLADKLNAKYGDESRKAEDKPKKKLHQKTKSVDPNDEFGDGMSDDEADLDLVSA